MFRHSTVSTPSSMVTSSCPPTRLGNREDSILFIQDADDWGRIDASEQICPPHEAIGKSQMPRIKRVGNPPQTSPTESRNFLTEFVDTTICARNGTERKRRSPKKFARRNIFVKETRRTIPIPRRVKLEDSIQLPSSSPLHSKYLVENPSQHSNNATVQHPSTPRVRRTQSLTNTEATGE